MKIKNSIILVAAFFQGEKMNWRKEEKERRKIDKITESPISFIDQSIQFNVCDAFLFWNNFYQLLHNSMTFLCVVLVLKHPVFIGPIIFIKYNCIQISQIELVFSSLVW